MQEKIFKVSMALQILVMSLEEIGQFQIDGRPLKPSVRASAIRAAKEYRKMTGNDPYEAAVNQWDRERERSEA